MMTRVRILEPEGQLLVCTDVHGNVADFLRVREIFLELQSRDCDTVQWAILGDIVHAPNAESRARRPDLFDYEDGSFQILNAICELETEFPNQIHFVLGNHDHAHIGGIRTAKFFPDEAAQLESSGSVDDVQRLHDLFRRAGLLVVTPCGVSLCHGAPGIRLESFEEMEDLPFELKDCSPRQVLVWEQLTRCYGQPPERAQVFLDSITALSGLPQTVVIHGHDRDESGYFAEGKNQLCPCIFGAPNEQKRYVLLDLSRVYPDTDSVVESALIRLYPTWTY